MYDLNRSVNVVFLTKMHKQEPQSSVRPCEESMIFTERTKHAVEVVNKLILVYF